MRPALLAIVLLLAGCGELVIDNGKVEKDLTERFTSFGVAVKSVRCKGLEVKKGDTFTCTITADDGSSGPIKVLETSDDGDVRYVSDFLKEEQVEARVVDLTQRQFRRPAHTKCPAMIPMVAGDVITCATTVGNRSVDVTVTQDDDQGHYSVRGPLDK